MILTHIPPLADPAALVKTMGKLHRRLVDDLRARAADPRVEPSLREAWAADKKQGRTGEPFETYRDAFCDQVGASWVLCTVFARTLEDRGYLPHRLAGPGAIERQTMFRSAFKFLGERDYLLHIFDGVSLLPGAREVFGPGFAALWRLGPTSRALGELLDELRAVENGQLKFTFGRPASHADGRTDEAGSSTRYLGDLYQDLNIDIQKQFALKQTPDFVERFLLDNTLDPALRERGCAVTVLDPACGSGHLLLGAYDRLFGARLREEPGRARHESAKLALSQVYGIDLNPYAAAVARFRLLLSYLDKAGFSTMDQAPEGLPLQVYVGDSLLAGRSELQRGLGDLFGGVAGFEKSPLYSLFDSDADKLLYKTKFDVVVANPPYITEKDAAKRELIRKHYKAAHREFSLSAPFAERIFQLGNAGAWTGQITANSFMKREFGSALVEKVFPNWDLTQVIDTSGAFIPGHGTQTVVLFARAQRPVNSKVHMVMGIRGEPGAPNEPSKGKVWLSIIERHRNVGFENEFISVAEVEREKLGKHPWSIGGGGAADLKEMLEKRAVKRLSDIIDAIGRTTHTGEDHALLLPQEAFTRLRIKNGRHVPLVEGEHVRDYSIAPGDHCYFPYHAVTADPIAPSDVHEKAYIWPLRSSLRARVDFGQKIEERGLAWWQHSMFFPERFRARFSISFAEVSTHNHFVLDRGGKVFKQTAPIIKLPGGATEDDHLTLLGYLNSSTACFWMKQVFYPKSSATHDVDIDRGRPENNRFAFAGTGLKSMPIPARTQDKWGRELDALGAERGTLNVCSCLDDGITGQALNEALRRFEYHYESVTRRMVAIQEELDWAIYESFGLCDDSGPIVCHDEVRPEHRPFAWEGAEPKDLPPGVAEQYRIRRKIIDTNPNIRQIETPVFKRLWRGQQGAFGHNTATFRERQIESLRSFLLTRAETFFQSRDPRPFPIRTIAAELQTDNKIRAVAEVLTGSAQFDLEPLLADLFQADAVASATCQVYSDEGIENRRAWEKVWDLQRTEDQGEKIDIEPPPKYDQKDFENAAAVWRLRGKLDVPKERFIAYPTATPPPGASGKPGLVFGWAGWDTLQKLQAAIELWQEEMGLHGQDIVPRATRAHLEETTPTDERLARDTAARMKLVPILQTMVDLLPWVKQWHDEDGQTASAFEAYISEEARKLETTLDEAHNYRRPAKGTAARGRKAAAPTKKAAAEDGSEVAEPEKKERKPRGRKPKAESA